MVSAPRMLAVGLIVLGTLAGLALGRQDDDKLELDSRRLMQAKTRHAKDIVEGLALENFETIARAAQDLMTISNETAWKVIQTPEYLTLSDEFRSSAERLREAAHTQNIDGATIAYFEVTLKCVQCHKYLRRRTE